MKQHEKETILESFKSSCEVWYDYIQSNTKREHLENNYKGRHEVAKKIRDYVGMEGSIKAYREIKDELAKIEIDTCQKHHECMPPIRDLYPASKELLEWIEERGY